MPAQPAFEGSDVRRDPATGRPRRIIGDIPIGAATERAAAAASGDRGGNGGDRADSIKSFLSENRDALELGDAVEGLRMEKEVSTPSRTIMTFQQTHNGLPVLDRRVVVQVDNDNRVKQLDLGHEPVQEAASLSLDSSPELSREDAVDTARAAIGPAKERSEPQVDQVWYPGAGGLQLAYVVVILTVDPPHDWRVVVEARSGEVLERTDIAFHIPDGQGLVFDPNPVVTANDNTFRDPGAAGTCGFAGSPQATIDAQRVTRTLRDLTLSEGLHRLEGPFCRIQNFGAPASTLPAEAGANDFNYASNDERFEAVNVYYHIDTVQRWIQSALGIVNAHNSQISCDPHEGSGGAWFSPTDLGLHFGDSGPCQPDRAEDGDVMLHEYGHAIQNNQVPGWGATNPVTGRAETRAMGEGFGDILACLFFAEHSGGFQRQTFEDWVFSTNGAGGLRRLDGTKVYPGAWTASEHDNGEIWSAALWNVYRAIGGDSMNAATRQAAAVAVLKTLITSHFSVAADATMPDGAEQFLIANAELPDYLGAHLTAALDSFHARGLLPCSPQADVWIRDDPGHTGTEAFGGTFWNSPDLWVRNSDDGGTTHQPPELGQDNYFHARVHNRGTAAARVFVVTFNVKPWAGVEFIYPNDFVPGVSSAVGFNLAPGASTIVKAKWPASAVPPAGTHACLLGSTYTPVDTTPAGQQVWERNNLAQKNLTVVDLMPGDAVSIPFQLGNLSRAEAELMRVEVIRPRGWSKVPVEISHPNPEVVRVLQSSIVELTNRPTRDSGEVDIPAVIRSPEPALVGAGRGPGNVSDSAPQADRAADAVRNRGGAAAGEDFLRSDAELVTDDPGGSFLSVRNGLNRGIPMVLPARTPVFLTLKVAAPAEASPGEGFLVHLVERNRGRQALGGISVQVNVVERT